MAERKRRGDDAVDERPDDALDEELDDEPTAYEADDEDDFDDEDDRGTVATKSRPAKARAAKGAKATRTRDVERVGFLGRIRNFVREVVAELRKVIWPTRKELLTYTAVVIVFVTIMFTIVAGLDYGFTKAMFWVFGNVKHK